MRTSALMLVGLLLAMGPALAENVDPDNDGSQYAWAENIGWLNTEPNGHGGKGIQVGDSELSGWIWGENIGWISLSCKNTLSCATAAYGVANDGNGVLSGYGWAQNVGWIDFAPSTSGVVIDPSTGELGGYAWGENIGWISFSCSNTASCSTADYGVKTGWLCDPLPAAPTASPQLQLGKSEVGTWLSWDLVPGATGSDVVRGELSCLLAANGDYSACSTECLDDDRTTATLLYTGTPPAGNAYWFLARGQNCGGNGTYGTGQRDTGIAASAADCP